MQQNQEEKEAQKKDNPALSKVIEKNIRTIIHLRTKAANERSLQNRIADAITSLFGTDDLCLRTYCMVWDMDPFKYRLVRVACFRPIPLRTPDHGRVP
jgi:hypothetical protein